MLFIGEHLHHTQLGYLPAPRSAVCCLGPQYICVAQLSPTVLHIHNIHSGEEVKRIELEKLLQDEKEVFAVSGSQNGKSITVTIGGYNGFINSLLLYQVNNMNHKLEIT